MQPAVLWFVRLSLEQALFTLEQATAVRSALGDNAELLDFAQKMVDDGHVTNVEALEALANQAVTEAEKGPPPADPFAPLAARPSLKLPKLAVKSSEPAAPSAPATPVMRAPGAIAFSFEQIASLDDAALANAFRELLRNTARAGASDLHLSTGARPFIRKSRALEYVSNYTLTSEDSLRINTVLLAENQKKTFLDKKDFDYALAVTGAERYRVNLMFHKNGAAGAYRMVPAETRTLAQLGYAKHNETLMKMLSYHNGLILITGPVGSGKTTTLASIVAHLNESREDHIITVEDPIEVVQPARGCNVTQREVGHHTKTFHSALKGALREDPDIIVIGELRDLETIEMAISASETGHLVIGTMHTSDATTTLNRLLDVFPPAQQTQIRSSVSESLRGIVCQRLLPGRDGDLVLACEILTSNTAVQALIKENKTAGLRNTMETGSREGMCLMDNVVFGLYQEHKITGQVALANITNRNLRDRIAS